MYNTCLACIKPPACLWLHWNMISGRKKKCVSGLKTKWLAISSVTKALNAPSVISINKVGLCFHVHEEMLWYDCNVFPYSHDMLTENTASPFTLSHITSATNNFPGSCYCNVLKQFPWFPFYKFWGQEGRAFLFLRASPSFSCIIRLLVLAHIISENKLS